MFKRYKITFEVDDFEDFIVEKVRPKSEHIEDLFDKEIYKKIDIQNLELGTGTKYKLIVDVDDETDEYSTLVILEKKGWQLLQYNYEE